MVIGVLAAISIVAFNGVQARASYSTAQQDLASIKKVLELYKADNGRYPNSEACDNQAGNYAYGWCGWNQGTGDSFIPGLSPQYLTKIPTLDTSLPQNDTYLYKASNNISGSNDGGGRYYALIRYKADGLNTLEAASQYAWTGDGYDGIAWGFKSDPAMPNW